MYAIETYLGRFEGETEKQAKAILRKAAKAHKAREMESAANRLEAQTRAKSMAYQIMARKATNSEMPPAWELKAITTDTWAAKQVSVDGRTSYSVETQHGRAIDHFYGAQPDEYVENGAGFCIALVFRNPDDNRLFIYGVGVCGAELAIAEIYGVSVVEFYGASRRASLAVA